MKYTKEIISQACTNSNSLSEICRKLGLRIAGGNFKTIKKLIEKFEIKINFTINRTELTTKKISNNIEDCLTGYYIPHNGYKFKKQLIKMGLLKELCSRCEINEWQGEKLSLHLDHINGNRYDYRLQNLRILCPNCHSLTDTYCGKNLKKEPKLCPDCKCEIQKASTRCVKCRLISIKSDNPRNRGKKYSCQKCNTSIHKTKSGLCKNCHGKILHLTRKTPRKLKIIWPDINIILEKLKYTSYSALGRELGVSDNAIRKHLKYLNVESPRKFK